MATIPSEASNHLQLKGWASVSLPRSSNLRDGMLSIAQDLGVVVSRQPHNPIETIFPRSLDGARPSSLSKVYGLAAFPLHTDTAHWTVPCRYVVLGCARIGRVDTPTVLVDANDPSFSADERLLLRSSTFSIKNGGNSFYGSLIDGQRRFTRFDPGCMLPVTESSRTAMHLYSMKRQSERVITYRWNEENVLIVDNWRMLHGRGNKTQADPLRRLLRVYVQ